MAIDHTCTNPECGHVMRLSDAFAGTMSRCPACGTVQRITSEPIPKPPPAEQGKGAAGTSAALEELGFIEAITARDAEMDEEPLGAEPADLAAEDRKPAPQQALSVAAADGDGIDTRAPAAWDAEHETLGSRSSMLLLLVLGLVGIVAGFLIGLLGGALVAYVGAAIGWLVGFGYGLVVVFGMDKGATADGPLARTASAPVIVCRRCSQTLQLGSVRCPKCGSTAAVSRPVTMTGGCAKALSYATGNIQEVIVLVVMFVAAHLWSLLMLDVLPSRYPLSDLHLLACKASAATAHIMVWSYLLRFCLHVAAKSVAGSDAMPDLPRLNILAILATGLRGFAIIVFYVVPVVTIPLLPLGLLAMAYAPDARALNVAWAARSAVRRPRDLAVTWLMLLMWSAAMALGLAVVATLHAKVVSIAPCRVGESGALLTAGISVVACAAGSLVLVVMAAAMFRCIGMFGRFNQVLLSALPSMGKLVRMALALGLLAALAAAAYLVVGPQLRLSA